MPSLTSAQLKDVNEKKLPDWIDRKKDFIMVDDIENPGEKVPYLNVPLPVHLRGKQIKRVKANTKLMHRIKRVTAGETIEISGGEGEKIFYQVKKTGSLTVREGFNKRTRKKVLCLGGTAVLEFDPDLYMGFNEKTWRKEDVSV